MEIKRAGPDQIIFIHDGVASTLPMIWVAIACVAVVAFAALLGGSWFSLIVVLVVGGFILSMLWRSAARTAALFDRSRHVLEITHTRGGTIVGSEDIPLGDISQVIVVPTGGASTPTASRRLSLRPAVVAGDRIVPLTYSAFEGDQHPLAAAEEIGAFLGLPEGDVIRESVAALARHDERIQPAVRLARLGLGLDRQQAAEMVARLRKNSSGTQ